MRYCKTGKRKLFWKRKANRSWLHNWSLLVDVSKKHHCPWIMACGQISLSSGFSSVW